MALQQLVRTVRNLRDYPMGVSAEPRMVRYRTALVTGATSGIGSAFAEALSWDTALLLTGRREDRLRRAAERLATPTRRVETIAADLASEPGRAAVIERAEAAHIDLFICNAGVGVYGPFAANPRDAEHEALQVNVMAYLHLTHALLPGMLTRARTERRRAGLVIVTSTAGFGPMSGSVTYAASKAFELQLARGLAAELRGEPIDVLALCPTYTDTEFFSRARIPAPLRSMAPEVVAREALTALGRRTVHFCGRRSQTLAWVLARNPILAFWSWPRKILGRLR